MLTTSPMMSYEAISGLTGGRQKWGGEALLGTAVGVGGLGGLGAAPPCDKQLLALAMSTLKLVVLSLLVSIATSDPATETSDANEVVDADRG